MGHAGAWRPMTIYSSDAWSHRLDSAPSSFATEALAEGAIAQLDDRELTVARTGWTKLDRGHLLARLGQSALTVHRLPHDRRRESVAASGRRVRAPEGHPRRVARRSGKTAGRSCSEPSKISTDEQLGLNVGIREQPMHVHEALHRALAHIAYHVGQILYIAKSIRGSNWTFLSIPPRQANTPR